uniref:[histone H3]-dimethyl-L-lysine(9) demethylase n=1 Tax=Stomoxys calcitrans TaxID=35570 RepID=A0A1I8Q0R3_STOCA
MSLANRDIAAALLAEMPEMENEIQAELNSPKGDEETAQEDMDEDNKPKTTLNELKSFRIQRKRENEEKVTEEGRPLGPPNKQYIIERHLAERKSIIEIHIDSSDMNRKTLDSELMKVVDLKEKTVMQFQGTTMPLLHETKQQTLLELSVNKNADVDQESEKAALTNKLKYDSAQCDGIAPLLLSKEAQIRAEYEEDTKIPNEMNNRSFSLHHDDASNNSQNEEDNFDHLEKLTADEELKDAVYRKTCKPFLQHLPCFKLQTNNVPPPIISESETVDNTGSLSAKIHKCRECRRRTPQQGSNDVYCRFYEFRCLQYTEDGQLLVAGFPNPYTDPTQDEINIWKPDENTEPTAGNIDIQVCRYILLHVGDQFCYLWRQEVEALKIHENPNSTIAWKKVVQGIREICDVCDTTLFNFHWTCDKCGFGVCLDCFKDRKENRPVRKIHPGEKPQKGRDEYYWLLCSGGVTHHMKELMLTQIIAGDALNVLGRLLHDVRRLWQIPQLCGCMMSKQELPNGELKSLIQDMIKESQLKQQTSDSSLATEETLRKQSRLEQIHSKALEFARSNGIDYVPGRTHNKQTLGKDPITSAFDNFKHINFLRKGLAGLRRFLPPRAMILTHSSLIAPGVPHEWLCDGKLLRLTNANHPDNRILFQEVWKCGQPVMISEVAESLNLDLWRPDAFLKDFGDKPNDLINCLNGNLVPNQPMRHFWEGFQCMKKRLLDANGKPMLLKLKDWPPGDDFAEILPTRYKDLMKGLPMPEYTLRTGHLNIASCLPKMFVPPDLGPKMYNAYGSAFHPDKGTTNLHLDISDAVNIMVYVGIPEDSDSKSQISASHKAIAMGGCEFLTRARAQHKNVVPGALWHIFPARDADKIRDLLNRVTLEKGYRLEPDHDPIHDQNWYLDDKLRARLFKEYGVEGYPIVQCLGDAVFIPAGAPHQVQNLHNCIKVAEDFVSPENITHCFHLTHEFRRLSHSHTNHEDKLQIKNIIYHAIKDCCTILTRSLEHRLDHEISRAEEMKRTIQKRADNDTTEFVSNS